MGRGAALGRAPSAFHASTLPFTLQQGFASMKLYLKFLLAALLVFSLAMGCKKKVKTQTVAPAAAGERGTSCQAKNDCGPNLSCITGVCQPADFDLSSTGKECYRVECEETEDCCGDKPLNAPTKCRRRSQVCTPTVAGCPTGTTCTDTAACGGGTCAGLYCSSTFLSCATTDNCEQDECDFGLIGAGGAGTGTCTLSGLTCTSNAQCTLTNQCTGTGICNCNNPNYDPLDPICTDADCDNICERVCQNELCVLDTSCELDTDCPPTTPLCEMTAQGSMACVECASDTDCQTVADLEDDADECRQGFCVTPCKGDAECPALHACDAGTCTYVGCRTNRECILARLAVEPGDPRLSRCDIENGIGTCKIECEIDAHCQLDQICVGGACEYIGCSSNDECKSILNLHNLVSSTDRPWIPEGECRDVTVPTP